MASNGLLASRSNMVRVQSLRMQHSVMDVSRKISAEYQWILHSACRHNCGQQQMEPALLHCLCWLVHRGHLLHQEALEHSVPELQKMGCSLKSVLYLLMIHFISSPAV
jgi:hypothetical protein